MKQPPWWGRPILALLLALVGLWLSRDAHADGKFFPPHNIEQPPAIPQQQALLTYRDGIEQLVIDSRFEGSGDRFAWIVPIPSAPTDISVVSPGLLKTLQTAVQPARGSPDPGVLAALAAGRSRCGRGGSNAARPATWSRGPSS